MKQKQNISLKLPIFSWLFFLFLSSGISLYHSNLQFGKPVLIERVDQIIANSGRKKGILQFSVSLEKSSQFQQSNSQFLRIKLLARKMNSDVHIILNRQYSLFQPVIHNKILHLRSRNLASNSSDDFPDFLS